MRMMRMRMRMMKCSGRTGDDSDSAAKIRQFLCLRTNPIECLHLGRHRQLDAFSAWHAREYGCDLDD